MDHRQIADLIGTLDKTRNLESLKNFIAQQPPPTISNIALFVYLGIIERVDVKMEFSNRTMVNVESGNEKYLQIQSKADQFYTNFTL